MTWDQIRDAQLKGINIGSHTHTHRVMSALALEEQKIELQISKKLIEEKIGKEVKSVAFPVGGYEHFHAESPGLAKEEGYKLAFSFHTGVNPIQKINAFDIKRIAPSSSLAVFEAGIKFPSFFAKLACSMQRPLSITESVN